DRASGNAEEEDLIRGSRLKRGQRPKLSVKTAAAHRLTNSLGALITAHEQHTSYMANRAIAAKTSPIAITTNSQSDTQPRQLCGQYKQIAVAEQTKLHQQTRYMERICRLEGSGQWGCDKHNQGQRDHRERFQAQTQSQSQAVPRDLE